MSLSPKEALFLLECRYPDRLKVFRSAEEIEALLDFDAVMKGGSSGVNHFKNDDPAWPQFIANQLASGKDVSVSPGGKDSLLVIVGNGLFKKRSVEQAGAASGSGGKVFSLDMNKGLWKDEAAFNRYHQTLLMLNKTVADGDTNSGLFLEYANRLDDIMQEYERKYGSIDDPIFFWHFATANALFLHLGKKFDEMGKARIAYVLNGHKEGLYKHNEYPSYPRVYIEKAFEHIAYFGTDKDREWIEANRAQFVPIASVDD